MLPFLALEPVAVHAALENLAVHHCRDGDVHLGRWDSLLFIVVAREAGGGKLLLKPRVLLAKLGQFAHAEQERVRQAEPGVEPYLMFAGLGIGAHGHLERGGLSNGRVGRAPLELGELAPDFEQHLLVGVGPGVGRGP